MRTYVVAISGASGPVLGFRMLAELLKTSRVHMVLSRQAAAILRDESGIDLSAAPEECRSNVLELLGYGDLTVWDDRDMAAAISSGSFHTDGMFIAPCSMKTLAGVACGYAETLIQRAADVTIKEGRRLVICPRETPLSAIHLENMLKLARLGVRMVPPMLGFYNSPRTLEDAVGFAAGKALDAMGVENSLYSRWRA